MNTRQAILGAAHQIEMKPSTFDFDSCQKPECGTPGCALGWVGFFLGVEDTQGGYPSRVACAMGCERNAADFYDRMNRLGDTKWHLTAAACASALRRYADKYHPAEQNAGIPDAVRNIFTLTNEQLREALDA
jgi:hypothetical protein